MENQSNFFNARGGAGRGGSFNYNNRGGRGQGRGFFNPSIRPNFSSSLPEKGKYTPSGSMFTSNTSSWSKTTDIRPTSSSTADSHVLGTRRSGSALVSHRKGASGFGNTRPVSNPPTFATDRSNNQGYNNKPTLNARFSNSGGFNSQEYNRNQSSSSTSGFYSNQQGYNKIQGNGRIDKEQSFGEKFETNQNQNFSSGYRRYPPSSNSLNKFIHKNETLQRPFVDNAQNKQSGYKFDTSQKYDKNSFTPLNQDKQEFGGGFRKNAPSDNRFSAKFTTETEPDVIEIEDEEDFSPAYNRSTFGREPSGGGFKEKVFSNKPSASGFMSGNKKDICCDCPIAEPSSSFANRPILSQKFTPSIQNDPSPDRRFSASNSFNRGGFNNRDDEFDIVGPPERKFNREERFDKSRDSWKERSGSNYSYGRYEPPEEIIDQSEEMSYPQEERYIKNDRSEERFNVDENYSQKGKYNLEQRFEPPEVNFSTGNAFNKGDINEGKFNRNDPVVERTHNTRHYPHEGDKHSFNRYEPPESRYNRNDAPQERFATNRSFNTDHTEVRLSRNESYNKNYSERGRFERDKSFNREYGKDSAEGERFERDDSFNRDRSKGERFERNDSFNRDHPKGERFNRDDSFHRDQPKGEGFYRDDSFNREHHEGDRVSREYSAKRKFNADDSFDRRRFSKQDDGSEGRFKKFERDDHVGGSFNKFYRDHSPKRHFNKEIPFKRGRSPDERYNRNTFEYHQPRYSPPSPKVTFDPPPREGRFSPPDYINSWNEEPKPQWSPPKKKPRIMQNKQTRPKFQSADIPVPNRKLGWSTDPTTSKEPNSKRQFKRSEKIKQATLNLNFAYNPRLIPPNPKVEQKMQNLFQRIKILPLKPSNELEVTADWINCAIVHKFYPLKNLKLKKINQIKKYLYRSQQLAQKEVPPPVFKIDAQKRSYVHVSCNVEATKIWLENTIKVYESDVPLHVIEVKDMSRKMSVTIPAEEPPATDEILKKFAEENSFDCSSWKIVRKKQEGEPLMLIIYMTALDYSKIESLDNKLLYDSKEVVFKPIQKKVVEPTLTEPQQPN